MAGLAGIRGSAEKEIDVAPLLNCIVHRGPDSRRMYHSSSLSAGVVASHLSDVRGDGFAMKGDIAVLLDGEICNDRNGNVSDAEIILRTFEKHGRNFPAYLNGAFACAVAAGDRLYLARDPVGIRPLYWGRTAAGDLCFASEMKALSRTAVDIYELHPSTVLSSNDGVSMYLPHYPDVSIPERFADAVGQLRELIFSAVQRRLEDGAAGGCFLSGGLDSSIIAAVMNQIDPSLPVFTVGIEGAPDIENAVLMAKHLGVQHHVYVYDAREVKEILPEAVRILESFDEDCIVGAIANLIASSFAAKSTNCLLSGEGGDELFGGYHLLKDLATDGERLQMMKKLIDISYNTAIQRLDRAMMGNSITYRVPFLDPEVIAYALQIPVQWKIHPVNGDLVEKYILREAFKDLLPTEIYQRRKLRFSMGTGTENLMDEVTGSLIDEQEFDKESQQTKAGYFLNSPQEHLYYKIFKYHFPQTSFEKLVGRWDPNK